MIGVNVNSYDSKKLKAAMDKEKMTWRSFADDGTIVGTWNLPGTPTFYVIDHQGVIRHKWVGSPADYKLGGLPDAKAIDAALEELIKAAEADKEGARRALRCPTLAPEWRGPLEERLSEGPRQP